MQKGASTRDKVAKSKEARPGTRLWHARHHTEARMGSSAQAEAKEASARRIIEKRREKDAATRHKIPN